VILVLICACNKVVYTFTYKPRQIEEPVMITNSPKKNDNQSTGPAPLPPSLPELDTVVEAADLTQLTASLGINRSWNPLNWGRLLWWVFFKPEIFDGDIENLERSPVLRNVVSWAVVTLAWLPFLVSLIAVASGNLIQVESENIGGLYTLSTNMVVFIVVGAWLLSGVLTTQLTQLDKDIAKVTFIISILGAFLIISFLIVVISSILSTGGSIFSLVVVLVLGLNFGFNYCITNSVAEREVDGHLCNLPCFILAFMIGGIGLLAATNIISVIDGDVESLSLAGIVAGSVAGLVIGFSAYVIVNFTKLVVRKHITQKQSSDEGKFLFFLLIAAYLFLVWFNFFDGYLVVPDLSDLIQYIPPPQ
jgi:hypothetical protein